jgi:hypothetical protein
MPSQQDDPAQHHASHLPPRPRIGKLRTSTACAGSGNLSCRHLPWTTNWRRPRNRRARHSLANHREDQNVRIHRIQISRSGSSLERKDRSNARPRAYRGIYLDADILSRSQLGHIHCNRLTAHLNGSVAGDSSLQG